MICLDFQWKRMTSLTGLSCLQFGHLTLIRCKKRTVKSKPPQMIPNKRVSKMRVSMSFIFYYLRPLTKYGREHLTSGTAVRRTRILVIFLLIRLKCFRKQKHGLKLLTVSVSNLYWGSSSSIRIIIVVHVSIV